MIVGVCDLVHRQLDHAESRHRAALHLDVPDCTEAADEEIEWLAQLLHLARTELI